jgi:hypothetical protein
VADKDKDMGIIIGDPWALDKNTKICGKEVVAGKTLDGETLKITIRSDNAGAKRKQVTESSSLFCSSQTARLTGGQFR